MTNKITKKIYEKLLTEIDKGLIGKIVFKLNDIEFEINSKDGIGGHIQEWFETWMAVNSIEHSSPTNSQTFPDFFVHDSDNKIMLEIKCFDAEAGANFDVANFESYCQSLSENPERIDSDYLIFSYTLKNGRLTITNVWLRKIWEICCASNKFPLKTQTKREIIYNIRPASFNVKTKVVGSKKYPPFHNKDAFKKALYDTETIWLKQLSDKETKSKKK